MARFSFIVCVQLLIMSSWAQLTFPSNSLVIPNSGLTLYWEHDDSSQTIVFGLSSNRVVNYYGIGFAPSGSYGMDNFDMVAFVFTPDTTTGNVNTTVLDIYSTKNGHPPTDESLGGTNDYILTDTYVGNGTCQVLFHRAYNTNDKYDFTFDGNVEVNTGIAISWAWQYNGVYNMTYHQNNRGTIVAKLADIGIVLEEF